MTDPSRRDNPRDPSRRRCTARSKRSGGNQCQLPAIRGATVCSVHGGRAPQVKQAAAKRVAVAQATAEWGRSFGTIAEDVDPAAVVMEQIAWTYGHVAWLRERVAELTPEALVWGVSNEVIRGSGEFPGVDVTKAAQVNVWVDLYGKERDRLVKMCEVAHRMGIEERQVRLAEQQGEMIADVIRQVLDGLGLTPEQQSRAPQIVARELRAIAGGAA